MSCASAFKLYTCNWPLLIYKAPVISAFLVLFQIVSHYFGSSSVTWRTPCQINAVFKGTDHFGYSWWSRITCGGYMTQKNESETELINQCFSTLLLLFPSSIISRWLKTKECVNGRVFIRHINSETVF